jgi:hypothetical protein
MSSTRQPRDPHGPRRALHRRTSPRKHGGAIAIWSKHSSRAHSHRISNVSVIVANPSFSVWSRSLTSLNSASFFPGGHLGSRSPRHVLDSSGAATREMIAQARHLRSGAGSGEVRVRRLVGC